MTEPKYKLLHKFSLITPLLGIVCATLILLAITWQLLALPLSQASSDPDISSIEIEATLPIYDPAISDQLMRDVYFDNTNAGFITTSVEISGTPTLTLTAVPAFNQPSGTYTFTTNSGTAVITYPVSVLQESQPGVVYTLVNTNEVTATAVISYLRDITQPVSTLDNLPPGGFVVTTPDPTLVLTGTVTDDESGVRGVWLDPGTGVFTSTSLADSGNWIRNTTWNYGWVVPAVDSGVYTLMYYGEDNIGHIELPAHVYTVTVYNDPVAGNDAYTTTKNVPLTVGVPGVLGNDEDPRSRDLTAVQVTTPINGELALVDDGSFVYTPTIDFVGNVSFTYKANNGFKDSNTAVVIINVDNTTPVANDDAYETDKNTLLTIAAPGVLDNDEDPHNRPLTARVITGPANGTLSLDSNGGFVYTPSVGFVGEDTFTYQANNGRQDSNLATVTITVKETDNYMYLPLVTKPPFEADGDIRFGTERFAGITTFIPAVPLDFSAIRFTYPPNEMKIWVGSSEPTNGWQTYASAPVFSLTAPAIGGQEIHVRLRYGTQTVEKSAFFFYIPNGDFQDGRNGVEQYWSPQDVGLPWDVVNNRLRLGGDLYGCNNVPFPASATASITLNVPDGDYTLHVDAMVYTYDKLPDPNQAIYDAFEVHTGSQIQRYGYSGPELLNCNTQRQVPVNSSTPLTSGNQAVSLENHSRFDSYYNTYTDVIKVWVDR